MITPEQLVEQALQAVCVHMRPIAAIRWKRRCLTADGHVALGCNVENASYPATICAERVALTAAVAQGLPAPVAIAVATKDGGSPCGICRQVMAELGPDMAVYIADENGAYRTTSVAELLPNSFTGRSLSR